MAGSVFFIALVALIVVAIVVVGTPFLFIPLVVIALGALGLLVVRGVFRRSAAGPSDPGPPGVPSTREASYEPVRKP